MKNVLRNYSGLIICVFVFVFGCLISPHFRAAANIYEILQSSAEIGLLATGMSLVIISGGSGIDLSVGSNVALGCMIAALTQANMGFTIIETLITAMFCSGLIGAVNGLLVTKGKLQPFIATLVTMIGARALALISNSGMPVTSGITSPFINVASGKIGPIFIPAFIWIIIILVFHLILTQTKYGRNLFAVGGNEESARYSGININRVRFITYTISGVLAGIAGTILSARLAMGEPRSGQGMELLAIAAVVIGGTSMAGGKGNILGTMFGVLTLGAINNLLNVMDVNMYIQSIVRGLIILVAILIPIVATYFGKLSSRFSVLKGGD